MCIACDAACDATRKLHKRVCFVHGLMLLSGMADTVLLCGAAVLSIALLAVLPTNDAEKIRHGHVNGVFQSQRVYQPP